MPSVLCAGRRVGRSAFMRELAAQFDPQRPGYLFTQKDLHNLTRPRTMSQHLLQTHDRDLSVIREHYRQQIEAQPITDAASAATAGGWITVLTKMVASLWAVLGKSGGAPAAPGPAGPPPAPLPTDVKSAIVTFVLSFFEQVIVPALSKGGGGLLFTAVLLPALRNALPTVIGGIIDGLFAVSAPQQPAQPAQPGGGTVIVPTTPPAGFVPY